MRSWFDQKRTGVLDGRIGFSLTTREFRATGREELLPSVRRNSFAVFAVEELDLQPFFLEFGGRIDFAGDGVRGLVTRRVDPSDLDKGLEVDFVSGRSFTGGTGSIGATVQAWDFGDFRVDLTSGYRFPALEELYSFGAHVGRLTFDIGNTSLLPERSNGVDISFVHTRPRFAAAVDVFYYDIEHFVFFGLTQASRQGLTEGEYRQGPARFRGAELDLGFELLRSTRLNLGMELVQATLRGSGTTPPRLPPLRARMGLDYQRGDLSLNPEIVLADSRQDVYPDEESTPGYGLFNMTAAYRLRRENATHQFAFKFFNAGDRLYWNHQSLVNRLVPAIGRSYRFSYSMEFQAPTVRVLPTGSAGVGGLRAGGPIRFD